jgi:hypothetical protein
MNVRLKHDLPFTAGFYYNNRLCMNNYNLRLWLTTKTTSLEDQNTAFERIKYFVYMQMDSTIFINQDLQEQSRQFVAAGLDVTTLPGDPVDQLVGIMLYFKLNSITENRMEIIETELSSTQGENVTYLHSDFEDSMDFDQPSWWSSPEPDHCDILSVNSDKIVSISQNTVWRDLELGWNGIIETSTTGNIVVFADFKQPDETK